MAIAAHLVVDGTVGASPLREAGGRVTLEGLLARPAWHADALCKEYPEVDFFPERGDNAHAAKAVCGRCLVRDECEAAALGYGQALHGVWGGTTQVDRRHIRADRRQEPPRVYRADAANRRGSP